MTALIVNRETKLIEAISCDSLRISRDHIYVYVPVYKGLSKGVMASLPILPLSRYRLAATTY